MSEDVKYGIIKRQFSNFADMQPSSHGVTSQQEYAARCHHMEMQMAVWEKQHEVNIAANEHLFKAESGFGTLINKHYGEGQTKFLVIGNGPSKFVRVEQISEALRQGWILIAVDSAVPFLAQYEIAPHYVMCFDHQDTVAAYHRQMPPSTKWILRVSCSPLLVGLIPNYQRVWYSTSNPFCRTWRNMFAKYPHLTWLRESATVIYSTIDAAVKMGATSVVTVGNDLGYMINDVCPTCGCPDIKHVLRDRAIHEEVSLLGNNVLATKSTFKIEAAAVADFPTRYMDCMFYDMSGGLDKSGWQKIQTVAEVK